MLRNRLIKEGNTIAALAAIVFLGWMGSFLFQSPIEFPREIIISEGQGVNAIADLLKEKRIIDNKLVFVAYVVVIGKEQKLQAGRYVFNPGDTIPKIARSMAEGFAESDDIIMMIPEGFNVFDIDKRLALLGLIDEGEFARKYYTDEGQFFPDTYRFDPETCNTNHGSCVDMIAQKMKNHLNLKFKDAELVLSTLVFNDTLIKASILEKEARREEDMRLVAGVIENRLERGMLLQIDATVSYGACLRNLQFTIYNLQTPKYCDVSQVPVGTEIRIDGPYNTYTRAGLPPGPIANPGITAIRAVLDPIKSDYLYYLSPRGGGDLIFSETAVEHATNRRKYLGL